MPITIDDLKRAMERDELVFHYQPKVSLVTEAVLRYEHSDAPESGWVSEPGGP